MDTEYLRLPVEGMVCPQCGLVQSEACSEGFVLWSEGVWYCAVRIEQIHQEEKMGHVLPNLKAYWGDIKDAMIKHMGKAI